MKDLSNNLNLIQIVYKLSKFCNSNFLILTCAIYLEAPRGVHTKEMSDNIHIVDSGFWINRTEFITKIKKIILLMSSNPVSEYIRIVCINVTGFIFQ